MSPGTTPASGAEAARRLHAALALEQAGRAEQAERELVRLTEEAPRFAPALHALALLRHRCGRREEALALLRRAAAGEGADAGLFNNLGGMLREAGRPGEAIAAWRQALVLDPGHLNARFNLAGSLLSVGDATAARDTYREVLARAPEDVSARTGLARALLAGGDAEAALVELRRVRELAPGDPWCSALIAQTLVGLGRHREAHGLAREIAGRTGDDARALRELAMVRLAIEDHAGAAGPLRALLAREPHDVEILEQLVRALGESGLAGEAVSACRAFVERAPRSARGLACLGRALDRAGQPGPAATALERALTIEPGHAETWSRLARVRTDLGDAPGARDALQRALALDPDLPEALYSAVHTRRNGPEHTGQIDRMERLAASPHLNAAARITLHFALGKACDDLGQFERAFRHFERGNALKRPLAPFDEALFRRRVEGCIQTFDTAFFTRTAGFGAPGDRAVFIVGMPRSGTTLVEQILASHPQVHGADELPTLGALAERIGIEGSPVGYPHSAAALDAASARTLGDAYLAHIAALDAGHARVTDKMPSNFLHLGLIAAILPGAHVVHVVRDPMDVCFSNFIQLFASAHHFSYDLGHIAAYHRGYTRLMAHWRAVLPAPVHEIRYEALIDDPEREARALVAHLGLPWDDACLAFHRASRPVRTASNWQVRQPLYRRARGRWRRYAAHLDRLAELLADEGAGET